MSTFKILEYGERADSLWGIEHKEITELELEALLVGFSSGNISQVCNKKRKSAYGYIWRYADE